MIEYCSSEEFEFKQDISLVVFNECYNVIAIRTAYRSCFDARNDEENYDFEVFLFQDNNLPEIKLFEPCFHVDYELYFIRFLYFIRIPFSISFHYPLLLLCPWNKNVLFFFLDRMKRGSKKKKEETHSTRIINENFHRISLR